MSNRLVDMMKSTLEKLGFIIQRAHPAQHLPTARRILMNARGVDLVLDVGANKGQYSRHIRSFGYDGRIVSFEPSSRAHSTLQSLAQHDLMWSVAPRVALGEATSVATLGISENSVSSSLRERTPLLDSSAPRSRYESQEEVEVRRLDDVAEAWLKNARSPMLKIDTQGYEKQVLRGAPRTLTRTRLLELELSIVPLYEGEADYLEILSMLRDQGFVLAALHPNFSHPTTGQLLQFDGVFLRRDD